ncbi:MAG: phytoene desaturase family protein [Acidothermaceae bacterium]
MDVDAIVIGSGPNGLVAANLLSDAGWSVLVLEAQPDPGGAVRSARYVDAEFISDHCSAFYPLGAASPIIRKLRLEEHGLHWLHAPYVLAHPMRDGRCAVLSRDLETTVAAADALAPGDGDAWRRLYELWRNVNPALLDAITTPFPPVKAGLRLGLSLRAAGALRFARFGVLPVRHLAEENFAGDAAMLLAGNALHADLSPEASLSGMYGWILAMLGQQVGFPVPAGGAGELSGAMVRRFTSRGGQLLCNQRVSQILLRDGRAIGVRTTTGDEFSAEKAILADVPAPSLYGGLVPWDELPTRLRDDMRRFQWDYATFKVDWALSAPVPWTADAARSAGTVHLGDSMDDLTRFSAEIAMGQVPSKPFLLVGQMTTADPSRSPAGTESLWAYTHVPQHVRADAGPDGITGVWDDRETRAMADRIEGQIESFAPGFRGVVKNRVVQNPFAMDAGNDSLERGALNGGTTALHQQLVFRPTPGLGRAETPISGLFLASASAHPGGGVHGACGSNAARAALAEHNSLSRVFAAPARNLANRLLLGDRKDSH